MKGCHGNHVFSHTPNRFIFRMMSTLSGEILKKKSYFIFFSSCPVETYSFFSLYAVGLLWQSYIWGIVFQVFQKHKSLVFFEFHKLRPHQTPHL